MAAHLIQEIEFDSCVGLQLVQALDPGREPQPVDVDGERRLPLLKKRGGNCRHQMAAPLSVVF
jgi:hypothetical protein